MAALRRDFDALSGRTFDVLVLGGGINGTGVARDAARRGLSVALIEKEDFGYGTTGRSTRLIHGGLRYLAMYDFALVRESLRERERLFHNAPHLVRPITFLIPFYDGQRTPPWMVKIGLRLYDVLKGKSVVPAHQTLTTPQLLHLEPGLRREGLNGGAAYGDGQVELVKRLCVENALDAADHGAVVANHALVERVEPEGQDGARALVRDLLGEARVELRAKRVVNTTGPWLDRLPGLVGVKSRMTKGTHFVAPRSSTHAILLFSPDDDRVFFSIPWLGHQLVGTTDTDFTDAPDDVAPDSADVDYLRRGIRFVQPHADVDRIHFAYAGIRNLVPEEGRSESDVSRKHQILRHADFPALVSLVGGKITPFRAVCEELVDLVAPQARASDTAHAPLPGAPADPQALAAALETRARGLGLPLGVGRTLATTYGSRAWRVLDVAQREPSMRTVLCAHAPLLAAEVAFVARDEMARSASDVLVRRTRAGWEPCEGRDALDGVLDILDAELKRGPTERKQDKDAFLGEMAKRHRFRQ